MRTGGSPAPSSPASARCAAAQVAARQAVRELLDRDPATERPGGLHVRRVDRDARSGIQRRLLHLRHQRGEVGRRTLEEQLDGRRPDVLSALASQAADPLAQRCRVRHAREGERTIAPLERGQQAAARVQLAGHEDQAGRRLRPPRRREDELLVAAGQRLRAPDHQHLRPAEEERRGEVVERGRETRRILVRPQRARVAADALAQEREPALQEMGLAAVQQVGRAQRPARQRRQRVAGARLRGARRRHSEGLHAVEVDLAGDLGRPARRPPCAGATPRSARSSG